MEEKYKMMTGDERLLFKGKELPFTILNYWQLNLSVLLLNVTRGGFAEYLVLCALSKVMPDALTQVKNGMEEFDIDGPILELPGGKRRSRIEVKSTASVQLDTPDEKEPKPSFKSPLCFTGLSAFSRRISFLAAAAAAAADLIRASG